jgi:hypothetical protein
VSNLVFVSGDFSSGTTLLFTLFRGTGDFHCLYEPLHEKLLEYLIHPLRPDEQHHPNVDSYFTEYRGFREIPKLFNPAWGVSELHLPPTAPAEDFYRYWSYLIGTAFGRKNRVMIKENRLTFRLGWIRARYPSAKIIHIYRDKEDQWNSVVRRGQEHAGRDNIGQGDVNFAGFNIARWCEDLKPAFPELDAANFKTGYDRFAKLWDLSVAEHQRYADISVNLKNLKQDFEVTCRRMADCIGTTFDVDALKPLVVPSEGRKSVPQGHSSLKNRLAKLLDRTGQRYARARLLARRILNGESR